MIQPRKKYPTKELLLERELIRGNTAYRMLVAQVDLGARTKVKYVVQLDGQTIKETEHFELAANAYNKIPINL